MNVSTQLVVGSIPTAGAIKNNTLAYFAGCFFMTKNSWGRSGDTLFWPKPHHFTQYELIVLNRLILFVI